MLAVPLAFLLFQRGSWRGPGRSCAAAPLVGLGVLVVLGPWMLRNMAEHGTLSAAGGLGRSLIARTVKYDEGFFDTARPAAEDDLKGQVRQFIRGQRNTIRNSRSVRSTQAGLMKKFNLTQAESDRLMRQVGFDVIAERPVHRRRRQPGHGLADRARQGEGRHLLRPLGRCAATRTGWSSGRSASITC